MKKNINLLYNQLLNLMRIQRTALLKEFGYLPNTDQYESQMTQLRTKLTSLEEENQSLRKKISETDKEKLEYFKKTEEASSELAAKDIVIVDLQNNIARLRNEIWKMDNSKAPVQIVAFVLFILLLLVLLT